MWNSNYRLSAAEYSQSQKRRAQEGMSLIELLVASAILMIVFIGILPLFTRAIVSNQRGAESSRMASFLNTSIETINQTAINYDTFNTAFLTAAEIDELNNDDDTGAVNEYDERAMQIPPAVLLPAIGTDNPTPSYTALQTSYWGLGERDPVTNADRFIGDETWMDRTEVTASEGQVRWLRDIYLFNYDISDVHFGIIDVDTQSELVQQGHPKLYDSPKAWDPTRLPDMREVRVIVRSASPTSPLGPGSLMVLGHYRIF